MMDHRDDSPHLPSIQPLSDPPGHASAGGAPPQMDAAMHGSVMQDLACRQCGINLRGLPKQSPCPSCGAPIYYSTLPPYLLYSNPQYITNLRRGLLFVIVCQIIVLFWSLVISGFAVVQAISQMGQAGSNPQNFNSWYMGTMTGSAAGDLVLTVVAVPFSLMVLVGWWLFSERDPALGHGEEGEGPRKFIRATILIMVCTTITTVALQAAAIALPVFYLPQIGVALIGAAAGIAQFFGIILYIRSIAPRLPSEAITKRADMYLWLLPVIYVAGSCLVVGPIVAMVMFLLFLGEIRGALRNILMQQTQSTPNGSWQPTAM